MPTTELDLPLCVSCGQVFRWRKQANGAWCGVDGPHAYEILSDGPDLRVRTNATPDQFRRLFQLDQSLAEMEAWVRTRSPKLEPYIAGRPGLRLMRPSSAVEAMFCFLCTPNNHLQRILQMAAHLGSLGEPIEEFDWATHFPTLEVIASTPESALRSAGFGYRAATIPSIAAQLLERGGAEWLEQLKCLPYRSAHDELMALKGVGPKLADCIALFALHHGEAVPVDTHLWQAAVREFFPEWKGQSLTAVRYRAIGDHFRDLFGDRAGWAHQYLFYDNLLTWRERRKENPK